MLPECEGRKTINKLSFVSMACLEEEKEINPIPSKVVIIKTRKINQNIKKDKMREFEEKL